MYFSDSAERCYKGVLFPELELVTEIEEYNEDTDDKTNRDKLKEYKEYIKSSLDKGTLTVLNFRTPEMFVVRPIIQRYFLFVQKFRWNGKQCPAPLGAV